MRIEIDSYIYFQVRLCGHLMVGVEESTEEVAQEDREPPLLCSYSPTEAPKQGLSFPHSQRQKFSTRKSHKDRKTALIPVPAGLGVRAGQPTCCNSMGVLLLQSQRLWGGALGAGQARLLRQLHKQTLNSANIRAVAFVQSGNTRGKNKLFKPPSQWREGQRHPQTAFFQRVVFCLKCHHSCAEVSSLMWPVKHIASRKFFNSPFLYDTAF